jgi:hypothetical protein
MAQQDQYAGATLVPEADAPKTELLPQSNETQPNLASQSPIAYAAQMAGQTMQVTGSLNPVQEQIWKVYDDALQKAQSFHQNIAEKEAETKLGLQSRAAAVTPGPQGQLPLATTEELAKGRGAAQARLEEETQQLLPRPELTAAATGTQTAPPGGWSIAQMKTLQQKAAEEQAIQRPTDQDADRVNAFVNGYTTADQLQKYHAAWQGGGTAKQLLDPVYRMGSREYKDYQAYLEGSITPLGRGVFGDSAQGATKELIQEGLKKMLINDSDDIQQGGDKTWMVKNRIINNLYTDRATAIANHKDPAIWDSAIGRVGADWHSDDTQQYHPGWYDPNRDTPIVQVGNSFQARAVQNQLSNTMNQNLPPTPTPQSNVVAGQRYQVPQTVGMFGQ